MEKSKSSDESGSDESGSDDSDDIDFNNMVDAWYDARRASIEDFYTKAEPIRDISTPSIEMRLNDDQLFVDLLVKNEYLFEAVRSFFENARQHVFIEDECRRALLDMVEQALQRRSELCYLYKLEVCTPDNNYPVSAIEEVEEEIHVFMDTLRQFVLKEEDVKRDERLVASVFNSISTIYRKVSNSHENVLHELEKTKELEKERNSANKDENKKMPPPTEPTNRQSSEEVELSQATVISVSTFSGTPAKK